MSNLTMPRMLAEVISQKSSVPEGLADVAIDNAAGILHIDVTGSRLSFRLSEFQVALNKAHILSRQD